MKDFLAENPNLVNGKTDTGFSPVILAAYYGKDDVLEAILLSDQAMDFTKPATSGGRIATKSVHGRIETYDIEPGDALWFPAGAHEVENVGPNAWRAAVVESKAAERRD